MPPEFLIFHRILTDFGRDLFQMIYIPFSKTNEQLKCYKFPEGDMTYDSIHKLLMALSQYGLKDDLLVQTLCEQLAEGICDTKDSSDKINRLQGQEFGIYIYHGIYDIPKKGSDHSEQWESEEIYSFLICVVAPVDKDYNAGTPKCGFIFPAFEERSAEPGKIDIFFEIPEYPDEGFLNRIIGQ